MLDRDMIERKLGRMEDFLREIGEVQVGSLEEFKANTVIKRFIERNLELALEQMLNVCRHIVSTLDLKEPDTYAECYEIIAKAGVLPVGHVTTFQSMARYRNMLVHIYDAVDDSITYEILTTRLGDFRLFAQSIRKYLEQTTIYRRVP